MVNFVMLERLILEIRKQYDLFNADFYGKVPSNQPMVNLKKLLVDDFEQVIGLDFVEAYLQALVVVNVKATVRRTLENGCDDQQLDFRYRIKVFASLMTKLEYNQDAHRYMAKIINDLMGIRVILPNLYQNQDLLGRWLESLVAQKVISRYYFRRDGNYRAIHCYFQSQNDYFPWELQIWDLKDARQNYQEHIYHEMRKRGQ